MMVGSAENSLVGEWLVPYGEGARYMREVFTCIQLCKTPTRGANLSMSLNTA